MGDIKIGGLVDYYYSDPSLVDVHEWTDITYNWERYWEYESMVN